jgi:hypothetical protein
MSKEPIIVSAMYVWLGIGLTLFIGHQIVKAAYQDLRGLCTR